MQFMGISIGILALVATAMLLFGRRGTLKILAWLVVLAVLGIGGTVGFIIWREQAQHQASNSIPPPPPGFVLVQPLSPENPPPSRLPDAKGPGWKALQEAQGGKGCT